VPGRRCRRADRAGAPRLAAHLLRRHRGRPVDLFVGPTGESLLVDTGNAGDRDLGRIVDTVKTAGVTRIDHLWTTHYHGDHVGALLALAKQVPVMHFYDHGTPHANDRIVSAPFLSAYDELSRGKRTIVKPGDKVRMAGLDITTVASANRYLRSNLPGGGAPNGSCAGVVAEGRERVFRSRQRRVGRVRSARTGASGRSISAT
jgi:phosphoribosyl 1,2-cyclic phosphodiesterase